MSELKERLRADLTASMKARDEVRTRTLRMALTEISKEEVSGDTARELDNAEVERVLAREAKRRREAAQAFKDAGRPDQASAELAEGEVLATYLPAQLADAELAALVSDAIAEVGATGPAAMGQVMKAVTPKVAGRAEGARVAAEVRRQLTADLSDDSFLVSHDGVYAYDGGYTGSGNSDWCIGEEGGAAELREYDTNSHDEGGSGCYWVVTSGDELVNVQRTDDLDEVELLSAVGTADKSAMSTQTDGASGYWQAWVPLQS